jgi:hypothetical protein
MKNGIPEKNKTYSVGEFPLYEATHTPINEGTVLIKKKKLLDFIYQQAVIFDQKSQAATSERGSLIFDTACAAMQVIRDLIEEEFN